MLEEIVAARASLAIDDMISFNVSAGVHAVRPS
jgi:hypothetical protein